MTVAVLRGDARQIPLPDGCVDLVVTSPPYFGLRSYTDAGEHYGGQIGSEATPAEWLAALVECTREWVRVLKPEGSIFINLGDRYASRPGAGPNATAPMHRNRNVSPRYGEGTPKSLLGLPWRYALAATDQLGLILRRDIIWAKPNGLPESVTDRCRSSHEYIFHMTKQPRYYAAIDEIRTPHLSSWKPGKNGGRDGWDRGDHLNAGLADAAAHPLGALPGSVWDIPSQPLTVPPHVGVDHFAAFPVELPRRIVLGWSPPGVCVACGQGRRPAAAVANVADRWGRKQRVVDLALDAVHAHDGRGGERWRQTVRITGYVCACPTPDAPTQPALVLDPFMGTGTTLLAANAYGRHAIGIDRSADYCRLAQWRVNDPGERAKAMQVPKPPPVPDGMEALF